MGWKLCDACGRNYNDRKGGCTNSACEKFDSTAVTAVPSSTNSSPKVPISVASSLHHPHVRAAIDKGKQLSPSQAAPSQAAPSQSKGTPRLNPPLVLKDSGSQGETSDAPALAWNVSPAPKSVVVPPKAVQARAEPFTLVCHRGEKSEWWPEPKMRLACGGLNVFEPWAGGTILAIWQKLQQEVRAIAGFSPASKAQAYAQYLRATGRPFALATARTSSGSFSSSYNYMIEIPNARTFLWGNDCTLGRPANYTTTDRRVEIRVINQNEEKIYHDTIKADYIVLNADTIEDSEILAFGHKTGTFEVTFLHDLPLKFIKSVNGNALSTIGILSKDQLGSLSDSPHKQTALKLFRGQ